MLILRFTLDILIVYLFCLIGFVNLLKIFVFIKQLFRGFIMKDLCILIINFVLCINAFLIMVLTSKIFIFYICTYFEIKNDHFIYLPENLLDEKFF